MVLEVRPFHTRGVYSYRFPWRATISPSRYIYKYTEITSSLRSLIARVGVARLTNAAAALFFFFFFGWTRTLFAYLESWDIYFLLVWTLLIILCPIYQAHKTSFEIWLFYHTNFHPVQTVALYYLQSIL